VKLMFDENLAARLVVDLSNLYPDSTHVLSLGLGGEGDRVIWIRLGNCATADVTRLLRFRSGGIRAFAEQTEVAFLELG